MIQQSNRTVLFLLLLLLAVCPQLNYGQSLILPGMPESSVSAFPQTQISNTGNSAVMSAIGNLRVSVWDGHTPGLMVDFDNGTTTCEQQLQANFISPPDVPYDPDVVLDASGTGVFIIVYRYMDQIFFEGWRYTAGSCNPVFPPTMISGGTEVCQYPNIDQANNTTAVVWQEGNRIKSRTIDWSFGLTPTVEYGACFSTTNSMPDIAVYDNGVDQYTHVVYTNEVIGGKNLMYQRHTLADLIAGIAPSCALPHQQVLKFYPSTDILPFLPRIAAPTADMSPYNFLDCQIVLTEFLPGSQTRVSGFTHHTGTYGPNVFEYKFFSEEPGGELTLCRNIRPVVSYNACSEIVIEWRHGAWASGNCLPIGPDDHILARQLHPDGSPTGSDYFQVSVVGGGTSHSAVSVSGRFLAPWGPNISIYSTYAEPTNADIKDKYSDCGEAFMKQAPVDNALTLDIGPNPFTTHFQIHSPVPMHEVIVTDIAGRIIWRTENAGTEIEITPQTWKAGIYLLRVKSGDQVFTHKLHHMN